MRNVKHLEEGFVVMSPFMVPIPNMATMNKLFIITGLFYWCAGTNVEGYYS